MAMFKAFKPAAMNKIAQAMGYQGDMNQFQQFIEGDPARQQQMNMYTNAAQTMAKGGYAKKYNKGGAVPPRRVEIKGQDHMLAYITPEEGELLKAHGGSGKPGPMGIPSFEGDARPEGNIMSKGPQFQNKYYSYTTEPGEGGENVVVRVGSKEDTSQARTLASQRDPNWNQGTSEWIAKNAPKPYDVRLAEYQAAQQTESVTSSPVQPLPQPVFNPVPETQQQPLMQQQPLYELSGTKFIPYNPLNQGYAAAVANFQAQNGPIQMAQGGMVKNFAVGGTVTNPSSTQAATPTVTTPTQPVTNAAGQITTPGVAQYSVEQMYTPGVPVGGTTIAAETPYDPSQDIAAGTGALTGQVAVPTALATTSQAQQITPTQANVMQATQAAPAVDSAMNATQAAQANPQDPRAQITAAQQTSSSVGNLQAAQGNAILINNPVQRQIQTGELVTGTGVDATAAAAATAATQAAAAQANPSQQAMVQDQLAGLMNQFVGGATPAWASGAIRTANAQMAARGLSASSIAGQAIVQAAMESAMPIAQADAATVAKFESQNLSNRQQSAMLAAEQRAKFLGQEFDQAFQTKVQNASRIADIANQNFTADQQVQLENSRVANTMNLQNLSNSQALVMSEAAALAQLDVSNLNNRQQVAVQNAQNFLQVDMANLSNQQQTELFKSQQRVQSLFTDQAATNAAAQFNASSQNQTDQFFANLGSQVSQFNATQQNAQAQFNAGQTNTVSRFNAELNNQRDQFNAQNQMVIAQSNAQWRRQIATADTAAVNRANELNANAILDISKQAYSNLWNYYSDTMEWAWTSAENQIDRNNALAIAELDAKARTDIASEQSSSAAGNAIGSLIGTLGSAWIMCWVAREVYGNNDMRWFIFRTWLKYDAPKWFSKMYLTHGEKYAKFISNKPLLKWCTKQLMDVVVERKRKTHNVQTV